MLYKTKVRLLKHPRINRAWRSWRAGRGHDVGDYKRLPDYIREYAPGRSFVDVGCMWGVNGEYAFVAEEAGATHVKGVDVFGPTPEFEEKKKTRNSSVEFILGDATDPAVIDRVGVVDVVFCAGVLYHHPSPFDVLVALRRMCRETLILRTATILEIDGLPNAAVYYPGLPVKDRKLWELKSLGTTCQIGINNGFEPDQGYGNWFWGLTPSCLRSLVETAGFRVERQASEAFVENLICSVTDVPFAHRMPGESEAREIARAVSEAGVASPW